MILQSIFEGSAFTQQKQDSDFLSLLAIHKQDLHVCMHTNRLMQQESLPVMEAKTLGRGEGKKREEKKMRF